MSDFDPTKYSITIRKGTTEDGECLIGTVTELPDVTVYEASHSDAYNALIEIITSLKIAADRHGKKFPHPQIPTEEVDDVSGRITLRISKSAHRKSKALAAKDGVPLNQWLVSVISEGIGRAEATGKETVSENALAFENTTSLETGYTPQQTAQLVHFPSPRKKSAK